MSAELAQYLVTVPLRSVHPLATTRATITRADHSPILIAEQNTECKGFYVLRTPLRNGGFAA